MNMNMVKEKIRVQGIQLHRMNTPGDILFGDEIIASAFSAFRRNANRFREIRKS
jgi:hypothetical protein